MAGRTALILSIGMTTSVGAGARETAAAVRAGIARLSETDCFDRHLESIVGGWLPEEVLPDAAPEYLGIPELPLRHRRMVTIASEALKEAYYPISHADPPPLFLGLPESMPDAGGVFPGSFASHLALQSGVPLDADRTSLFPNGRAAGCLAIEKALEFLAGGRSRLALVGGVDTFLDRDLLCLLDREGRVASQDNPDGFIPGEGAAFLCLGSPEAALSLELSPIARIEGVGIAFEKGHLYGDDACLGEGLAAAFRNLFASAPDRQAVRSVYCTLNGEHFGAKEWGAAYLRNRERFAEEFDVIHPADCFGDAGAAMAPLLIGLGAEGLRKGYRRETCLVWCSSDRGDRGAVLVGGGGKERTT
jgi:3-oxoacyl-[acyl-carrier-protein] synthase-1